MLSLDFFQQPENLHDSMRLIILTQETVFEIMLLKEKMILLSQMSVDSK
jgi:hypothetical protein